MVRGTTPTYIFTFPEDIDLSVAEAVYVTFANKQYQTLLEKTGDELEISGNTVSVFLDQEETLTLQRNEVYIQINWTYNDDGVIKRACSEILRDEVGRNLINEVI